jgi:hypothetical protein
MHLSAKEKLEIIAGKVGDLNNKGRVKGFSGNENGYAKIIPIKNKRSGAAVWIHHWNDGRLIIDLTITHKAAERYKPETGMASTIFKKFAGSEVKSMPFRHSIDDTNEADMLYIDVTDFTVKKLEECVDELLRLYKKSELI